MSEIIGAFSEENAERLSGVSVGQLRRWDRIGLLRPSYGDERHTPYGRVYSFRDLVSLRVLGELRNKHRISVAHLLTVNRDLSALSDEPWSSVRLEVLGKRVVIVEPGTRRRRMAGGNQLVLDIQLPVIIASLKTAVAKLNERGPREVGKIVRAKFVAENQPVLAGTRIPVAAIKSFAAGGYDTDAIIKEYPDLTATDVRAALAHQSDSPAA
jgi:uncharacterized protein (DUF433 family)/DNA-binding transcriptional MerR regulator